ncbi:deoxyribonuclease IV [Fructilactobacillus myrtifloralis]|uniref:Probable endonuclease 4 n=1 Tax=Fructilactobacillus myrtifloralis TaxID=2940301 RepID=A0ABY5BPJ2_9LACO|nr:deoxyribonuclease IV [Fructilactobacillus myrtifloralis]USS85399.1 deoxyribonuclease IV [Fructilactobacillus myrtifloralis]
MSEELLLGSHVGMKAPDMFLGSAKEAAANDETAFMVYTGAPQNSRRKPLDELEIPAGKEYMHSHGLREVVVHAPYIINLANTKKPQSFGFAVDFLRKEVERSEAMGATQIVLHPGSHVGAGVDAGLQQIIKGLNQVINPEQQIQIALETMAGKGTELGTSFEQLQTIIAGVEHPEKLSVTFDTCHTYDAGYDVKDDFAGVLAEFDRVIGLERLKVIHLNDDKNPLGSHKDRHENIGFGTIGFPALNAIAHDEKLAAVPKIMETPAIKVNDKVKVDPHGAEVAMLRNQQFDPEMIQKLTTAALED